MDKKTYMKTYNQEHGEARKEYDRAYYQAHKDKYAAWDRERLYGITDKGYKKLITTQDWRCAICSKTLEEAKQTKSFCVEHDHNTGRVRGLVCLVCNRNIAWYERYRNKLEAYIDG